MDILLKVLINSFRSKKWYCTINKESIVLESGEQDRRHLKKKKKELFRKKSFVIID